MAKLSCRGLKQTKIGKILAIVVLGPPDSPYLREDDSGWFNTLTPGGVGGSPALCLAVQVRCILILPPGSLVLMSLLRAPLVDCSCCSTPYLAMSYGRSPCMDYTHDGCVCLPAM